MQAAKLIKSGGADMPTLHLSAKQLPEVKVWRVGGRYRVLLELEQLTDDGTFNILSAQPMPTALSKDAVLEHMAKKAKV